MAACAATCALSVASPVSFSHCNSETGSLKSQGCQKSILGSSLKLTISRNASKRRTLPVPKAVQDDPSTAEVSAKTQKVIADLQAKWENVEDKPSVLVFTGGALVTLWLSSAILGAFESVPLFPKLFQLIGLGYTTWFVYRYLLFTPNRQELYQKFDDLTSQITGDSKGKSSEAKWTGTKIDGTIAEVKSELEEVRK